MSFEGEPTGEQPPLGPETETPVEAEQTPAERSRAIWKAIRPEIWDQFVADMMPEGQPRGEQKAVVSERLSESWRRERQFVLSVCQAVAEAVIESTKEPVVALFDVDNTLGAPDWINGDGETKLRPSAEVLLRTLKETWADKVTLGLFTTRHELSDQLNDPKQLQGLKPYLDPAYLITTRSDRPMFDQPPSDDAAALNEDRAFLEQHQGIVDIQRWTRDELERDTARFPLSGWDRTKLAKAAETIGTEPDKRFVFVDDAGYPELIDEQVASGLSVKDAAFWLS